jgi:Cu(I)/Ag(I) efflux system membrane protein CusA/SilA
VQQVAQEAERLLRNVPGTASVIAERISQGYFVDARLDLERMAQHGVTVDEALSTVRFAIGGDNVVGVRQPDKSVVPLSIQYSPEYIDTLAKVRNTPVVTDDGRSVPLGDVADVAVREAPEMIRNDNGELAGYIYVYLRDVTGPEYVEQAREYLQTNLKIPVGYSMEWTGNYKYAEDARSSLRIVVPITLAIMFVLLMMAFNSVADSSLIMLSAPFALVGGILLQAALGFSMTTAVIIGYVSLFAVAIQTGIIMIEFIREALATRTPEQSYMDAVVQGSVARLRPKLMTVATTVLGLLPIMFASGSGMDITKPIATPTFGGMISSTIYVLFLIPCLFAIGEDIRRRRPEWFVRKIVPAALLLCAVLSASCGGSQSASSSSSVQTGTAGEMTVTFLSDPNPPKSGDNRFLVTVKQPDGTPVADGEVKAIFSMPAMPSMNMPAMRSDAALSPQGGGVYRGTGQLSMSGTWNVEVSISRKGQDLGSAKFSVVAK